MYIAIEKDICMMYMKTLSFILQQDFINNFIVLYM